MDRTFFDRAQTILRVSNPGWYIWYAHGTGYPYRAEWYAQHGSDGAFFCAHTAEELSGLLARAG